MPRYPQINTTIFHTPRPSTEFLGQSLRTEMSTSPSLLPQSELEPPSNTTPAVAVQGTEAIEYPQFLLLGDSITQFSTLTWHAYLQTQYIRRLDVINRGLSGFTAPMGFQALQQLLPTTKTNLERPAIKVMTVFFGANDACVPGESQHVELQEYIDILKHIVKYPVFNQSRSAKTEIIIITPPPINEHQMQRQPSGQFQRRAGITSQYARAAREAAEVYGVHCLDFWSILMRKVGWNASMGIECCCKHIPYQLDQGAVTSKSVNHIPGCCKAPTAFDDADYELADFLTDGLHLTKLGYDILFWRLLELIKNNIPQCAPENLPFMLPEWRDVLKTE